jgi:hypothetical protein
VSLSLGSTFKIGWSFRLQPSTLHFTKDMEIPPYSDAGVSFWLKQFGQYQGAGVFTDFGLRLRHLAQRKRLPFTAVFGRTFFPVLGKFFAIATSTPILSDCVSLAPRQRLLTWSSQGNGGERVVTPPECKCVE